MPIRALGPTYAGGIQPIVQGGYSLIFLPDVNNWELQRGRITRVLLGAQPGAHGT